MAVEVLKGMRLGEISIVNDRSNNMSEILSYNRKTGDISGVASVEVEDTYGTILDTKTMDIGEAKNIYYNHKSRKFPIGKIRSVEKGMYNGKRAIRFSGSLREKYLSHDTPEIVRSMVSDGSLSGISIGFSIPRKGAKVKVIADEEADLYGNA